MSVTDEHFIFLTNQKIQVVKALFLLLCYLLPCYLLSLVRQRAGRQTVVLDTEAHIRQAPARLVAVLLVVVDPAAPVPGGVPGQASEHVHVVTLPSLALLLPNLDRVRC